MAKRRRKPRTLGPRTSFAINPETQNPAGVAHPHTGSGAGSSQGTRTTQGPTLPSTQEHPQTPAPGHAAAPPQPAGPSIQESATYRRAARRQRQLIREYVTETEKNRLIRAHVDLAKDGTVKGLKVPPRQIGEDVKEAAARIQSRTRRLLNSARVKKVNAKGRVVSKQGIKEVVRTQRTLSEGREHPYTGEVANPISPEKAAIRKLMPESEKSYDIFIDKAGKPEHFSDYAPLGWRIAQAVTGADSYAGAGDVGNIAEVVANAALMVGSGGAGAAAKGARAASAAERLATAERAAAAPEFVGAARGARTVASGERTGEAAQAAKGTRLGKAARTRYAQPARALRSTKRKEALALRAINPIFPAVATSQSGRALVEGHLNALTQHPGDVLDTTVRTALGIPGAAVAPFIDIATGNADKFAQDTEDYLSQYGELFSGDPQKVEEQVTQNLGLVPALSAVLGATAIGRATGIKAPSLYSRSAKRVEKLARDAEYGKTPAIRRAAKRELEKSSEIGEPLAQRHAGRKREAERSAAIGELDTGQWAREAREGGKRRGKVGKPQSLPDQLGELHKQMLNEHISEGDVVGFLGAHRITPATRDPIAKVERIRDTLRKSSRDIDPDEIHTRAVIDAILDHPEVIERVQPYLTRAEAMDKARGIERHSERTDARQTTRDPKDVARYRDLARDEGIPMPNERPPEGYAGKLEAKHGRDMEKAIRAEARVFKKRAVRLEAQANSQRKARPERAKVLEGRAEKYRAEAEARLAIVDRFKRANKLDIEAHRLAAAGKTREAAGLRAQANELRVAGEADQARRTAEFEAEMQQVIAREGYGEPVFRHETDITNKRGSSVAAQDFPSARGGKKERFRTGVLAETGRVDESALTLIQNTRQVRAAFSERLRQRGFLNDQALRVKGERFRPMNEWDKLQKEGKVPAGYEFAPVSKWAQGIQRNDALRKEVANARARANANSPKGQRELHVAVPRAARREYEAQMEPLNKGWRAVRAAGRLQTIDMLATSPAWFSFQYPATWFTMAMRNPNPAAWVRSVRRSMDTHRNLTREERTNLASHFGGNPADFLHIGENVRGLTPGTVDKMDRSAQIAFGTPAGKIVESVWQNIRKGGPLIALNRRYESFQRRFMAMLEMDRASGVDRKGNVRVSARPREFIGSASLFSHLAREDIKALKGKTYAEQTRYYLDNPKRMRKLEKAANDAYGNWSALTAFEKRLASVVIFYPFVRFSMRWLFWSFPKNNPVKAGLYLNLAQQNAQNLQEFLGGPPSFFSDFGKVVTHTGPEGALETKLNLGRAMPGGNVIVETIGGAKDLNLQTFTRPFQPLIGSTLSALAGQDQYGEDLPEGTSKGEAMLKGILGLSPLTRRLQDKVTPPSEWSQLFRAVGGRDQGLAGTLLPDVLANPEADKTAARLGRMLETASAAPSFAEVKAEPDKATQEQMFKAYQQGKELWAILDRYLVAYGITTEAELKGDEKTYGESSDRAYKLLQAAEGSGTIAPFSDKAFGGGAFDDKAFGATFGQGGKRASVPATVPKRNDTQRPAPAKHSDPKVKRTIASVPSYVPAEYRADIARAASEYDVRPELLAAQLRQESGFDPNAQSPAGAQGIAQFMPGTAASVGLSDPSDPHASIEAQAKLMGDLQKRLGSEELALAAYNAGEEAVQDAGGVPDIPETQAYVKNILAAAGEQTAKAPKPKTLRRYVQLNESAAEQGAEQRVPASKAYATTIRKMVPEMQSALVQLAKNTGIPVRINEGYRTAERAQDFPSGLGSHHHLGIAADVDNHADYTAEDLAAAGLNNTTVVGEPWHFEINASVTPTASNSGTPVASSAGTSYAPSGTPSGTTSYAPALPSPKKQRQPKPRFSKLELLNATQQPGGLQQLLGLPPEAAPEADATMAALAEIATTRKRLLKR